MSHERITRVPRLAPRDPAAHKGTFGSVLAIAGSRGMAGAAALVGASALRGGAGKVRVACCVEVQPTVAGFEPSYMTWPLRQDERGLPRFQENRADLTEMIAEADVVAIGPGLGRCGEVPDLVAWVLEAASKPLVIDADALNALTTAGKVGLLHARAHPTIATPHPGEFARMTGLDTAAIQEQREARAQAFVADAPHLVLVLKGAGTLVVDRGRTFVNTTGNPGMATGGAGDCLTGVIAALLAQGLGAFEAAQLGVFAHGLAGDVARDQSGEVGMIAGDIVDALPDAFEHLAAMAGPER